MVLFQFANFVCLPGGIIRGDPILVNKDDIYIYNKDKDDITTDDVKNHSNSQVGLTGLTGLTTWRIIWVNHRRIV